MKTHLLIARTSVALLVLLCSIAQLRADITVRLSVKFILDNNGAFPPGTIGTNPGFQAEVDRGNVILAATGRGFQLQVVEYLAIRPAAPVGQPEGYWFSLDARNNRATFEAAALADKTIWQWNENALNIHVNGSGSGQCSFVGSGLSISLGDDIGAGTVLHEIGHFFNLRHTHVGDNPDNPNPPVFTEADLADGDGLTETANDNPNITTKDQLCGALFNTTYSAATPQQRAVVDSTFENVMSYHNENILLPVQMDIWGRSANGPRLFVCNGRTWFVAIGGADGNPGNSAEAPFATISRALMSIGTTNDIILARSGTYNAPPGNVFNIPCTLRAAGGSVTVRR